MNERGFFTIIGLCLLIIVAIFVKGINEFETNYSNGISNSLIEYELKNIAESALIEAKENLPTEYKSGNVFEVPIISVKHSQRIKNLDVKVVGVYSIITEKKDNYVKETNLPPAYYQKPATILLSVASCDGTLISARMYCRSLAYILESEVESEAENDRVIYFVNEFSAAEQFNSR